MVRALLAGLVPPVLPKQMLWQPQHFAGESCDLVCCLKVCSWNEMINWDSWLLLKNNPFLAWERKWKWVQPHVWKAPKWVDHHCYVAALVAVNLMDSLPVLWYLESHLLGLKHVGMAALVHSNLKSLLSELWEDSSLSGEPGRKGCSGSFQQSYQMERLGNSCIRE